MNFDTVTYNISGNINAVLPADFNADGLTDILVTVSGKIRFYCFFNIIQVLYPR